MGWIVGLILLGGLLVLAQISVGWEALLRPWQSVAPGSVALAFGLLLLSFVVRSIRIQVYFKAEVGSRFPRVLRLMLVHNLLNNLLPMRTGEASFPILMGREFGAPLVRSVPGLFYLRLLDLHFVLFLGIAVLAFQRSPGLGAASLLLAPLPLLLYLARKRVPAEGPPAGGRVWPILLRALQGLPGSLQLFAAVWLWTAVNWTIKLAAFAWILTVFAPLSYPHALIGATTGELSSVLPFHGLAGAGTYEAGVIAGLMPLGADLDSALTGAVNLHLFALGTAILAGVIAMAAPRRGRRADEAPGGEAPGGEAPVGGAPVGGAPGGDVHTDENPEETGIFDR